MKKRILLVDDTLDVTTVLKFHLDRTGKYAVRVENAGMAALDAAREFKPELILLDLMMPDLDGASVAEQIRSDPSVGHIKIVFLSANVTKAETQEEGRIGGQRYISKLLDGPELLAQIAHCLEE